MTPRWQAVTQAPPLPARPADGHKGDFGRVLAIGGSRGMIGAAALAANAALRGGAGLVAVATPQSIQLAVATLCPCATSIPLACDADGQLAAAAVAQALTAARQADVLAAGCGLAQGVTQQNLIRALLAQPLPLVLDADGLNALVKIPDWPSLRQCPLILTPHPGEFSRLTGRPINDLQARRCDAAFDAAAHWRHGGLMDIPLVLVLKGAQTVVTDAKRLYVNDTGNPGMATGGSGDVLTGLIAGLLGQLRNPFDAAVLGVRLHGRAGDLAADRLGQVSLIASDLLEYLPPAIREHCL